ncbi:MAG: hypothetical protein EOP35_20170, partial [Rubrivivax sp.]
AITCDPEVIRAADRVVLPGQGAMRDCMAELAASGAKEAVLEAAATKPLLGVCVGMQMLLDHSEEQDTPGLGLIPGRVQRFRLEGQLQPDAASSAMQSRMAPWPGSTTRSAARITSGSQVMATSKPCPSAAWITACDTERRLPMP